MKRSRLTEGSGVPIELAVDGINRHDVWLTELPSQLVPVEWPMPSRRIRNTRAKGLQPFNDGPTVDGCGYTADIRSGGQGKAAK